MTQSEIEQKATGYNLVNSAPGEYYAAYCAYTAGYNACILDSQNQIDKLTECLREIVNAEWMVTHDWGGDRDALLEKARTLLATFTDKK